MERKEAFKYIAEKLREGVPKHVIYRQLLPKVPYKEDLLQYISEIPDNETCAAVKTKNRILMVLLILLLVLSFLYALGIILAARKEHTPWFVLFGWVQLLIPLFLLYVVNEVRNYRRIGYRVVFLLAIINVTIIGDSNLIDWLVFASPWVPAVFLAYIIMKKSHPYDGLLKSLNHQKLEADLTREAETAAAAE